MQQNETSGAVLTVAVSTTAAAHRRDHQHGSSEETCHPHAVEVVHLGSRAVAVCHDCQADTGFLPLHGAEEAALEHRLQTRTTNVALLPAAATSTEPNG